MYSKNSKKILQLFNSSDEELLKMANLLLEKEVNEHNIVFWVITFSKYDLHKKLCSDTSLKKIKSLYKIDFDGQLLNLETLKDRLRTKPIPEAIELFLNHVNSRLISDMSKDWSIEHNKTVIKYLNDARLPKRSNTNL